MTTRSIGFLTIILALSAPAVVQAATYQWRDDNGVTHFTDNGDSVPERYLKRAKEVSFGSGESEREAPTHSSAPPTGTSASSGTSAAEADKGKKELKYRTPGEELKEIQQTLPRKKKELATLHHKWTVAKGRTPTEKELKDFEKKRAKGNATFKDNPYINEKPLSTPGAARLAYYQKVEEIRSDEERMRRLEKDLEK